jgi:hypothetical protein
MIKGRLLQLFLLKVFTNQARLTANTINALQLMCKPENGSNPQNPNHNDGTKHG